MVSFADSFVPMLYSQGCIQRGLLCGCRQNDKGAMSVENLTSESSLYGSVSPTRINGFQQYCKQIQILEKRATSSYIAPRLQVSRESGCGVVLENDARSIPQEQGAIWDRVWNNLGQGRYRSMVRLRLELDQLYRETPLAHK